MCSSKALTSANITAAVSMDNGRLGRQPTKRTITNQWSTTDIVPWLQYMIGSLEYSSIKTILKDKGSDGVLLDKGSKTEVLFRYSAPYWARNQAWEARSFTTVPGFDISIHSYSIIPRNSYYFKCAREGNLSALQTLFAGKHASPFDREAETGMTALHVSHAHPSRCRRKPDGR